MTCRKNNQPPNPSATALELAAIPITDIIRTSTFLHLHLEIITKDTITALYGTAIHLLSPSNPDRDPCRAANVIRQAVTLVFALDALDAIRARSEVGSKIRSADGIRKRLGKVVKSLHDASEPVLSIAYEAMVNQEEKSLQEEAERQSDRQSITTTTTMTG